jgi:hypothetical protein
MRLTFGKYVTNCKIKYKRIPDYLFLNLPENGMIIALKVQSRS